MAVSRFKAGHTLLRKKGKYRSLLDAYMIDRDGVEVHASLNADPAGARVLESYKLKLKQSEMLVERQKKKIAKLESTRISSKFPGDHSLHAVFDSSQVDAMGRVTSIFFEMLLSTDYFKFDEATGDILAVTRARKVIIPASDIAVYLNWRYRPTSV